MISVMPQRISRRRISQSALVLTGTIAPVRLWKTRRLVCEIGIGAVTFAGGAGLWQDTSSGRSRQATTETRPPGTGHVPFHLARESRAVQLRRARVLDCGSPLPLWERPARLNSGRGLPQSKTLARHSEGFVRTSSVFPIAHPPLHPLSIHERRWRSWEEAGPPAAERSS